MNICMRYMAGCALLFLGAGNASAQTVKASVFGFNSEDATQCLQKAIDSKAKTVIVDNVGKDWIIGPIRLASDQEIVIEKNVTVRAKKGAFKGKNDYLFFASSGKNIILRGEGNAVLVMNKKDYQNAKLYTPSEWRHCINLLSCENVTIRNLTLKASGGDGVYLGNDWRNQGVPYCKNVLIENVVSTDHHRQGISVISAENLIVRNCVFNHTEGTPPASGIDFEPNGSSERLVNCLLENCEFRNNQGSGIEFFLNSLGPKSLPVSITVKNCFLSGNRTNVLFMQGKDKDVRGRVEFLNCKVNSEKGRNISVMGLGPLFSLDFNALQIDNSKSSTEAFSISSPYEPLGKISFADVMLKDSHEKRSPFGIHLSRGKLPLALNFTGSIVLNGKPFDINKFSCDFKEQATFIPDSRKLPEAEAFNIPEKSTASKVSSRFRIRSRGTFLQFCERGKEYEMILRAGKAGKYNKNTPIIKVYDSAGKQIQSLQAALTEKNIPLKFKAENTGFYRIEFDPRENLLEISSPYSGQGFFSADSLRMMYPSGRFYFEVPAGVEKISLMVAGDPGEYVTVSLMDMDGRTLQRREHFDSPYIFTASRKNKERSEIWSLLFENAVEDVTIRSGRELNGIFTADPALLIRSR